MVSSTPRLHFTPGKDPVPILLDAELAPWPVWTGGKSRPHRVLIPNRPTRSSVAIPTELPGPIRLMQNIKARLLHWLQKQAKFKLDCSVKSLLCTLI